MKTLKFTFATLCIVGLATITVYAQSCRHSQEGHRKAQRQVWEIIHKTDLAR